VIFEISGRCKNRKVVDTLLCNLVKELGIADHPALLEIRFVTESGEEGDETYGWAIADQEEGELEIAKTYKGQKVGFLMQMRTIVHEMVHIKQFLKGELDEQGIRWYGELYDNVAYGKQPWEIEAYGREDELFMKCYPFDMDLTSGN
jgi:hypothetical protein